MRGKGWVRHSWWLRVSGALLLLLLLIAPEAEALPKKPPDKPINLNTATPAELEQLPGIGPAVAERIVRHREKQGPFRRVEELLVIRGISQKKFEQLRPYVYVVGSQRDARDGDRTRDRPNL